ncbi:hypothetical protein D1AOALGA4SA_1124 [Olavius algarvensis Delta 1 endosymbiont]|nr:hypothetical protein D1AOALGA4SA_1124 [Olavius algarvensis Delta 1 endosymbiont]
MILYFGFWIADFGFKGYKRQILDFGFRILDLRYTVFF